MENDQKTCDTCNISKPWRRFRLRIGNVIQKETNSCSECRAKKSRAETSKKIQAQQRLAKRVVLNRTHHKTQLELNVPYYYPDIEKAMAAYCNTKTAMDRKYLRDNQDKPISTNPRIAQQQTTARQRAQGWIGLYDEILNHCINLLRQTGNRPPWAQMEGKADLHRLYGVHDTQRAALLRAKG